MYKRFFFKNVVLYMSFTIAEKNSFDFLSLPLLPSRHPKIEKIRFVKYSICKKSPFYHYEIIELKGAPKKNTVSSSSKLAEH